MSEIQRSADQIVKAGTTGAATGEEVTGETVEETAAEKGAAGLSDIIEPTIQIIAEQQVFDASAKVIKVADEIMGSILDIKAWVEHQSLRYRWN